MTKRCPVCEKDFLTSVSKRIFCSVKCSVTSRKNDENYIEKLRKPKKSLERKMYACKYCNAGFESSKERKYCSPKCGNQDRLLGKGYLVPIECRECKQVFKPHRSSLQYCCARCASAGKTKDPDFIDSLKAGCRRRSAEPGYKQILSEAAKKRWKDPEFRKMMDDIFDSDEWLKKSTENYSTKDYVFPSGRVVRIQGYEDKALDDLIKTYDEKDIVVDKEEIRDMIGIISYYDSNGAKHRYVPDIYLKSLGHIIEVKSEWTYRVNQRVNELKKEACLKMGLGFSFMIY